MVDGLVGNRDRRGKRRARRERQQVFVRHVQKGVIEPLPSPDVVRRCNRRTAGHGSGTRQRQSQNPDRLASPHVATPSISPENTPDIEFIRTLRSALQSGCNEWPPWVDLRRLIVIRRAAVDGASRSLPDEMAKGSLTEPIAATQPRRQEPLFNAPFLPVAMPLGIGSVRSKT